MGSSERIVGIKTLLIISVHLPCRGHTLDVYQEILDELHEIITKYSECSTILVGGDMNASVLRHTSKYNLFIKCIEENNLHIPDLCGQINTFHHYNGRDHSQIDYFLQNRDVVNSLEQRVDVIMNSEKNVSARAITGGFKGGVGGAHPPLKVRKKFPIKYLKCEKIAISTKITRFPISTN